MKQQLIHICLGAWRIQGNKNLTFDDATLKEAPTLPTRDLSEWLIAKIIKSHLSGRVQIQLQ